MDRSVFEVPPTEAIENGDTIRKFVIKEKEHVVGSTGKGLVYNAGKAFHTVVSWCTK